MLLFEAWEAVEKSLHFGFTVDAAVALNQLLLDILVEVLELLDARHGLHELELGLGDALGAEAGARRHVQVLEGRGVGYSGFEDLGEGQLIVEGGGCDVFVGLGECLLANPLPPNLTTKYLRRRPRRLPTQLLLVVDFATRPKVAVAILDATIALRVALADLNGSAVGVAGFMRNGIHLSIQYLHAFVNVEVEGRLHTRLNVCVLLAVLVVAHGLVVVVEMQSGLTNSNLII